MDVHEKKRRLTLLYDLLKKVYAARGSDLHLANGERPFIRISGTIRCMAEESPLYECEQLAAALLPKERLRQLEERGSADSSHEIPLSGETVLRVRINTFRSASGVALAIRLISDTVPTMDELRFTPGMRAMLKAAHGLILVTGPTGSGKSTTLAAMVRHLAEACPCRIITIEDPIEYYFRQGASFISQREVGRDCVSFSEGLKSALRQDPDVILLGEMRDAESVKTALAAAETGHLVLSTMHTGNVVEAADRVAQYFPTSDRSAVLAGLANCCIGIVAQQLLVKKDGGRVAAFEVLTRTPATVHMIRSDAMNQWQNYMRYEDGMQSMQQAVQGLKNLGLV